MDWLAGASKVLTAAGGMNAGPAGPAISSSGASMDNGAFSVGKTVPEWVWIAGVVLAGVWIWKK